MLGIGVANSYTIIHFYLHTENTWFIWIYTSQVRWAGTDANIYLVAYGNKGKSDEIWLDNESNNFESGQTDKFKKEICDIGRPYKIRIGHDNSNPAAAWHLNKVRIGHDNSNPAAAWHLNKVGGK